MDNQRSTPKRLAVIRIELSEAQKEQIRRETGADATEALVAGYVSSLEPLRGEVAGPEAEAIAAKVWEGNQEFVDNLAEAPKTREAFQRRIGHQVDRHVPNFAILR